jgi:hypothetical protein
MKLHIKIFIRICLIIFMLIFKSNVFAQVYSETGLERSNPKQLNFLIGELSKETEKIGLTRDTILLKCKNRFKESGLEPVVSDSTREFLFVGCSVAGKTFTINLQFERIVEYKAGLKKYFMLGTTWFKGWTGTHGGNIDYVLRGLDDLITSFLKDYLKANTTLLKEQKKNNITK